VKTIFGYKSPGLYDKTDTEQCGAILPKVHDAPDRRKEIILLRRFPWEKMT
jgi:hypothetical protein